MDDRYLTIEKPSIEEIKVKGSRFIGRTDLAATVDEALDKITRIRKTEYAATHNCYAYVLGLTTEQTAFKYSDDGEPSGTAGRPIYDVVSGSGLTNILLVVTRYFGGTKLGTGGLVRAYGEAARAVLEKSGTKENFITDRLGVTLEFPRYDALMKAVHSLGAVQIDADFSNRVKVELEIRRSKTEQLIREIMELSQGKAEIERR